MRIRKGRVPTGDRIVEAKDWVGMGRTAAAGFWSLRRACARAGRRCRGGRAVAAGGFVARLPDGWVGQPPGLPSEVIRELAARARTAERALRQQRAAAEAQ